jgi:hypothetical protein
MTNPEAYKVGFLARCAEEGLDMPRIEQRIKTAAMIKRAVWGGDVPGKFVGAGTDIFKKLLDSGKLFAMATPPMAGTFGGYLMARANENEDSVAEAQRQEELAAYYQAIEQLARNQRRGEAA